MKKVLLVLLAVMIAQGTLAQKKKDIDLKEFVKNLKWDSPERTKYAELNEYYDQGDSLYKHIMEIDTSLVFYDVKMIVNAENGDTIVSVVDDKGNIRSGNAALKQYIVAVDYTTNLTNDAAKIINEGMDLRKNIDRIVSNRDLLASFSTVSTLIKATNQIRKMYKVIPAMLKSFNQQRKKIKAYQKQANIVKDLSDPTLRNLPDVVIDESATLTKSEAEIIASMKEVATEDGYYEDDTDILEELNKLD